MSYLIAIGWSITKTRLNLDFFFKFLCRSKYFLQGEWFKITDCRKQNLLNQYKR